MEWQYHHNSHTQLFITFHRYFTIFHNFYLLKRFLLIFLSNVHFPCENPTQRDLLMDEKCDVDYTIKKERKKFISRKLNFIITKCNDGVKKNVIACEDKINNFNTKWQNFKYRHFTITTSKQRKHRMKKRMRDRWVQKSYYGSKLNRQHVTWHDQRMSETFVE